jgi:glycosyltransferase involved in cell wall biosynthesis
MKLLVKKALLRWLFNKVDTFLCIGTANRRLYQTYDVSESKLRWAPYAVDNARFESQARALLPERNALRAKLGIPQDAVCVLFCGKFVSKKHPMDVVRAATLLQRQTPVHLLFAGSGELGPDLRTATHVTYDAESPGEPPQAPQADLPTASFAGFMNQTQVSQAYVAADALVLPSDYGETWGLVVNEAMASGLPCIISDRCGSAQDLGTVAGNRVFPFGNVQALAESLASLTRLDSASRTSTVPERFSFAHTVESVVAAYNAL